MKYLLKYIYLKISNKDIQKQCIIHTHVSRAQPVSHSTGVLIKQRNNKRLVTSIPQLTGRYIPSAQCCCHIVLVHCKNIEYCNIRKFGIVYTFQCFMFAVPRK